jgi:outer membrane murein-binding lipoprotein Lpp
MKRSIIIMAAIILLALPLAGCVTDDSPDETITPLLTEISNLKNLVTKNTTDVAKLKEDVAKKADSSRVDNLATSIGQSANVDAYTKAEIDAIIKQLKENQSWINTASAASPTNSASTVTNQIAVKNYSMSPSMIYGAGDYTIFVEVKNGYADAKKIVLTCTLTPDSANVRVKCDSATKFSSESAYISGTGDKFGTNVSACGSKNPTNLIMGTSNQIIISGNGSLLIPVKFTLAYMPGSGTAIWTPTWSSTIIP